MVTPKQPGWYDDPGDSKAQRYWDGQDWTPHRRRMNTTPGKHHPTPLAAPPPPPQMSPPTVSPPLPPPPPPPAAGTTPWDQSRPHVEKGQQFRSGLSRQRKILFAVVGAAVIVCVFAFGANQFRSVGPQTSSAPGGTQTSSASGSVGSASPGVDKSSQSYRMGLKSGTNGDGEEHAFGTVYLGGRNPPMPYEKACKQAFTIDNVDPPSGVPLVEKDYMAGCLDGLNHQSAEWTKQRSAPTEP